MGRVSFEANFPIATFITNLITGVCGGFITFSIFLLPEDKRRTRGEEQDLEFALAILRLIKKSIAIVNIVQGICKPINKMQNFSECNELDDDQVLTSLGRMEISDSEVVYVGDW